MGNIRVLDFKTSHVRTFFSALSDEGLAHSTIKGLYGLLNPSFELAVEDGLIRKNPVTGTLGDYGAPAKEKEALTLEQQEKKNPCEVVAYAMHRASFFTILHGS